MDITESNFEAEVLQSDMPIVVDCYTQWCGPCKILKPLLVEVVGSAEGVRLGFLDIENNPNLAERLRVTAVPKVLIFKDGEEVSAMLGVQPKKKYEEAIEDVMSSHGHEHSINHRDEIMASEECGCFYCLKIFAPGDIKEWVNNDAACCPHCGVDSIIGSQSGLPITTEFLQKMHNCWFKGGNE